jgi:hypothetical protein
LLFFVVFKKVALRPGKLGMKKADPELQVINLKGEW